jgi:hypothetical protein
MPQKLYYPKIIQELPSDEIAFTDGDSILDSTVDLTTVTPVRSVATSNGQLAVQHSRSLVFRSFGIPADITVVGIELELTVTRLARIQDKTIQLWYQNRAVGRNLADLTAEDHHVYGGATDLWRATTVVHSSDDFGVLVDLQPHTQYPSSNTVYLRSVRLRVWS